MKTLGKDGEKVRNKFQAKSRLTGKAESVKILGPEGSPGPTFNAGFVAEDEATRSAVKPQPVLHRKLPGHCTEIWWSLERGFDNSKEHGFMCGWGRKSWAL